MQLLGMIVALCLASFAVRMNPLNLLRRRFTPTRPWQSSGTKKAYCYNGTILKMLSNASIAPFELNTNLAEAWFNKIILLMLDPIDMSNPSSKRAYEDATYSYDKATNLIADLSDYQQPLHIFKMDGG